MKLLSIVINLVGIILDAAMTGLIACMSMMVILMPTALFMQGPSIAGALFSAGGGLAGMWGLNLAFKSYFRLARAVEALANEIWP